MKKLILSLAVLLTLTSGAFAPKANAFGIVNLLSTGRLDYVGTPRTHADMMLTVMCIALLPLCILEEGNASAAMDFETLLDQGYTEAEARNVLNGQKAVLEHLANNNQQITTEGNLNVDELADAINKEVPGVEEYTEFVRQNF